MCSLPVDSDWVLSASQLETFSSCQRKWAWEKIAGFKPGDTTSTALGGRVHKILEDYLNYGILPDQSSREGQIATQGLHLIPQPRTAGMTVEFEFRFQSPRGNMYTGRKDYIVRTPGAWPVVGDHKTTSDWKWCKDSDDLRTNIQAIIYAADELLRSQGAAVDLEWIYYPTKVKADARKVSLRMLAPEVEQGFQAIDDLADQIHQVRATIDADHILDLPPTLESCEKYGGCPHRFRCNFTPQGRLSAVMASQGKDDQSIMSNLPPLPQGSQDLMARLAAQAGQPTAAAPPSAPSPLDLLRARQPTAAAPPPAYQPPPSLPSAAAPPQVQQVYQPPPPPAYQPPPVAAPPPTGLPSMPGTYAGPGMVAPPPPSFTPAAAPPQTPALVPPGTPTAPPPPAGTWYTSQGINLYSCPCGLQVSDGILATSPHGPGKCPNCGTPAQHFPAALYAPQVNPPEQALPPPPNAAQSPGAAAPPPPPPAQAAPPGSPQGVEKPKRHRRTKAEMEAARAAEAAGQGPKLTQPDAGGQAAADRGVQACEGRPIGRLLIDTLPVGQACHTAEEAIFAPARAMVKQATGKDDYRQIDFGNGPGVFVSAVMSVLENGSWDTMYVDSRSADAMHAITVLAASSDETYRGMA